VIVCSALFSARSCRRNDVTICSTSPILWTVDRSIIASVVPFSAHTYALYEPYAIGEGAFPR
jgi:hypothetical protein